MGPLEWKTSLNAVNCEYLLSCTKSGTLPPKLHKKGPQVFFSAEHTFDVPLCWTHNATTLSWQEAVVQMVEFEKYTFQLCAVGHLWHLLNKRYLVSIHSCYSCFIFTFQPNVSLAPFDESLRGISNEHWIRIEVNFVNVIVDGKCRVGSSRCPFPLSMVWDMSSG